MTNQFPRVTAILARIPDAATRWPGWFTGSTSDTFYPHAFLAKERWHGGDLDPRNMHHLWAMLEAVVEMPTISNGGCSRFVDEGRTTYTGATVIEAMLWCLEEATR